MFAVRSTAFFPAVYGLKGPILIVRYNIILLVCTRERQSGNPIVSGLENLI